MPYTYEYPRAALTVDCVVFGFSEAALSVLLIRRGIAPYKGKWALPGGFVRVDETIDEAARRELSEETGIGEVFLEQLYTFGAVKRDPREPQTRLGSVKYFWPAIPLRNVVFLGIVLAHGFRRLLPPY